jgi:hypothetical protein
MTQLRDLFGSNHVLLFVELALTNLMFGNEKIEIFEKVKHLKICITGSEVCYRLTGLRSINQLIG